MANGAAPEEEHPPESTHHETCPGCGFLRPVSELLSQKINWKGELREAILCLRCRTDGIPPEDEVSWEDVLPRHRALLLAVFDDPGMTFHQAAKKVGIEIPSHGGNGIARLLQSAPTRRAYRALLDQRGLTLSELSRNLRLMTQAQKPMWNNRTQRWDFFPDNQNRLKAWELIHKLHDLMPKGQTNERGPIEVHFHTNLETPHPEGGGEKLVVEVPRRQLPDGEDDGAPGS